MFVERIEKPNGVKVYNMSTSKDKHDTTRRVIICKAKDLLNAIN